MTDIRPRPRLDEVPELDDVALDLTWARINDVCVRPVIVAGAIAGWLAVIMLVEDSGMMGPRPLPWILPIRQSEAKAREDAATVLRCLLQARSEILADVPTDWAPTPAVERAMAELYGQVRHEWTERRNAFIGRTWELERGRRLLAETVPDPVIAWGARVRSTRQAWGWTQRVLASKVGLDVPRLSKIENGKLDPPRRVTLRLCDALDLDPPEGFDG